MHKLRFFLAIIGLGAMALFIMSIIQIASDRTNSQLLEEELMEDRIDISGTWHSNEDFSYIVTFNEGGTYEDIYNGETLEIGQWSFVESVENGEDPLPPLGPNEKGYLKKTGSNGSFYYSILTANESQLELIYLGRGNILTFSKVE